MVVHCREYSERFSVLAVVEEDMAEDRTKLFIAKIKSGYDEKGGWGKA